MGFFFYRQFLVDLRTQGDSKFARRVLSKVIDAQGQFSAGQDDHRYQGIPDAWIRYVSMGGPAYRVIYIRSGVNVYLYRAGPHSVEDGLSPPRNAEDVIPVIELQESLDLRSASVGTSRVNHGALLENRRPPLLRDRLLGRRFYKHKEVLLVSPYLSREIFSIFSPFGKVLFDLLSDGSNLTLITKSPTSLADLRFFEDLEARGFSVLFEDSLHAKLYIFDGADSLDEKVRRMAVLGSANLTAAGIGLGGSHTENVDPNEELCYELPSEQIDGAIEFAAHLSLRAIDIPKRKVQLARQRA